MRTAIPAYLRSTEAIKCILWSEENSDYPAQFIYVAPTWEELTPIIIVYQSLYAVYWVVVVVCNCYMYRRIIQTMNLRAQNTQFNHQSNGFEKQLRQVAVMIITNGTIFFLCCSIQFINQIISILSMLSVDLVLNEFNYFIWGHVSYLSFIVNAKLVNACVNPTIYFATNQRYRSAFITLFLKIIRSDRNKSRERDGNIRMHINGSCK